MLCRLLMLADVSRHFHIPEADVTAVAQGETVLLATTKGMTELVAASRQSLGGTGHKGLASVGVRRDQ